MQLKTPAAWNRKGGRRRREGSADRSVDRLSLDGSRAESARTKSPVEKALDQLLGEYLYLYVSVVFYPNLN